MGLDRSLRGIVSVTSTELSAASAIAANANSVLSQAVSVADAALSVRADTLSQAVSVLSQQLSGVSQQVSALSQAVSILSQAHSVLSQAVSVISAGLGGVQLRVVTGAQVLSAAAFANVSGLSLSVASAATYQIDGRILWTTSILTGTAFGFTYPGGITPGSMTMEAITSVIAAGPINMVSANFAVGRISEAQMSTLATAQLSVLGGASATTHALEIYGLVRIGATAGVIQLQAKQSATGGGVQILAGSYLRGYKVQ